MTIEYAKRIVKEFKSNGNDVIPAFYPNMRVSNKYTRNGPVTMLSFNNMTVRLSPLEDFFEFFLVKNRITFNENKEINEDFVFTSVGLITKEEFDEAVELLANTDLSEVIHGRNLIDNTLYQLQDGRIVFYLGSFLKNFTYIKLNTVYGFKKLDLSVNHKDEKKKYFITMDIIDGIAVPNQFMEKKAKDKFSKVLNYEIDFDKLVSKIFSHYELSSTIAFKMNNFEGLVEDLSTPYNSNILYKKDNKYYIFQKKRYYNSYDFLYEINNINQFKSLIYKLFENEDEVFSLEDLITELEYDENFVDGAENVIFSSLII